MFESLSQFDPKSVAIGISIASIVVALLMQRVLKMVSVFTSNTKTKIDEILLANVRLPIQVLIITFGFFLAVKYYQPDFSIGGITILQIFSILWIISITFLVSRIIKSGFEIYTYELKEKMHRKIDDTLFNFLRKLINFSVYIVALSIILKQFGIEITPLLAGLGIAGIAVAMALKDTLSNFLSAIYITADRPMKLGDYIELDSKTAGYVVDIGWRTTRLKTWDHNYLILPNSKIAESVFRNYNAPKREMTTLVSCGVSYDSDLNKVEKVALTVAKKVQKSVDGTIKDYIPSFRFREFGDNAITFTVSLRVKNRESRSVVVHEFIKALKSRFDKEKIEIPFPQMDVHVSKD
jgi:small-conductance mechanosensitive channel